MEKQKLLGKERRQQILAWLKASKQPITGKLLAERTKVSRQVIVQDISLLKAQGEKIIATSRGYIYVKEQQRSQKQQRIIAVSHNEQKTKEELYILVDHGVTIINVMVEHPLYGDITGSLMIKNRKEVDDFIKEMERKQGALLSMLTNGVHLHTIEADTAEQLEEACAALKAAGILLET